MRRIASSYRLPYFTLTPTFSVCPTHGYLAGEHFTCPKCDDEQPCEVYSRVVGYLRPVQQWNKGKKAEYQPAHEFVPAVQLRVSLHLGDAPRERESPRSRSCRLMKIAGLQKVTLLDYPGAYRCHGVSGGLQPGLRLLPQSLDDRRSAGARGDQRAGPAGLAGARASGCWMGCA